MKIEHYLFLKESTTKNVSPKMAAVTHKNCPDGAAAALLLKLIFPKISVFHCAHNRIDQECLRLAKAAPPGSGLIIADICPSQPVVETLMHLAAEKKLVLCIYDHHESTKWLEAFAQEKRENIEIIFDNDRCGSKIVFDRYWESHKEILQPYQEFIEVSNDRDLWLKQHKKSDELAMLHSILGDLGFVERFLKNPTFDYLPTEASVLEYATKKQKDESEKLLRRLKIKTDSRGFRYGVIYGEGESSNLLNEAIERNKLEYAMLINLHTCKGSIRGKGNFDCAAFAEKHGGGGHKCASGFRVKVHTPDF